MPGSGLSPKQSHCPKHVCRLTVQVFKGFRSTITFAVVTTPSPLDSAVVVAAFPEYSIAPAPLGHGGMKSAFRIVDSEPLALKVLHDPLLQDPHEGSVNYPDRVQREIEAMKQISHPRIVPIIAGPETRQIGDGTRVWYVEPLFEGGSLANRLATPWPETKCISLLVDLATAAEVLHTHNMVHRDIKPDNIVFDDSDRPVLLDLGIVYVPDLSPLTESWQQSPKTLKYAAPEQFRARRYAMIDFRTDLFLIGIVIFEALTSVHPFNPSDRNGYLDRLNECRWDNHALDAVNASPGITQILRRLMDPRASRRYRKFEHLRADIEECK